MDKPLTPQKNKFAVAVASGMSQADAYRKAYPRSLKWKLASVYTNASMLMADTNVSRRVKELQEKTADASILKAAEVLREIRTLAHADVGLLVDAKGRLLPPHQLPAEIRASIASVKLNRFGEWEYKLWDKGAALEKAAKILGLYALDNKQKADALSDLLGSLSGNVAGVVADPGAGTGDE